MNDHDFARHSRRLLWAWLSLLALMLLSLGSAYLRLGMGNAVAGLAIAAIKAGMVALIFMRLARAGATVRLVATGSLGCLALLMGLSGIDYLTRAVVPSPLQPPRQLPALIEERTGR